MSATAAVSGLATADVTERIEKLRVEVGRTRYSLLLTAERAAHYLGISSALFYEAVEADPTFPKPVLVPSQKGRSRRKYRREDLRAWVRSLAAVERG